MLLRIPNAYERLYAGAATLRDILILDTRNKTPPPTFAQALTAYAKSTGATTGDFRSLVGIAPKANTISWLKNASGPKSYRNARHPKLNAARLVKLSQNPHGLFFSDLTLGRIPVLFYDQNTGTLLLRTTNTRGETGVESAQRFLSESGQRGSDPRQRITYMRETVEERLGVINQARSGSSQPPLGINFKVKPNTRMEAKLAALGRTGITPVYLIPPLSDDVLETSTDVLEEHLEKVRNLEVAVDEALATT